MLTRVHSLNNVDLTLQNKPLSQQSFNPALKPMKKDTFEPSFTGKAQIPVIFGSIFLTIASMISFSYLGNAAKEADSIPVDDLQREVAGKMEGLIKPDFSHIKQGYAKLTDEIIKSTGYTPDNPLFEPLKELLNEEQITIQQVYSDFSNASSEKDFIKIADNFLKTFGIDEQTREDFIDNKVRPQYAELQQAQKQKKDSLFKVRIASVIGVLTGLALMNYTIKSFFKADVVDAELELQALMDLEEGEDEDTYRSRCVKG